MKKEWLYAVGLVCLVSACTGTPQSSADDELCSIDVAGAMEKPAELKLSELGSDVRYVPLETTDSCLVGGSPNILLLDKEIVVFSRQTCFIFDKESGKFLSKVGHLGDDPEAYSTAAPTYNDVNGLLYFMRRPGKLQKYDLQGNYRGGVTIPTPPDSPSDFSFTDSVIIGRYGNIVGDNGRALLLFNETGEQLDTVPSLLPVLPNRGVDDINSISVKKQGNAGIILTTFKSGDASASVAGIPFSTGKWHWGAEARTESKDNEKRLLVGCIFETDHTVFFQCIRGLYTDEPETFNGIYDRKANTTRMYAEKEGIKDDLTGFMAFHPKACSAQGEYGMIIDAGEVMTWLEENPEAAENEKLSALKELTDDSNPVVIITVPK